MPRAHLLVVSHTPHYQRNGVVVGWAATVREIDQLATRFETVHHVACLYDEPAPDSAIAYAARNVELVGVPPAGGDGALGKFDALRAVPTYARAILRELPRADMVHVRAPANIALVAMGILAIRTRPTARWFKYAGDWRPAGRESRSYTLQRRWLQRGSLGGIVTVNGTWPDQPPFVRTFDNPSLDDSDLARGRAAARGKRMTSPVELVFVGQLLPAKGAGRAIEVVARLREHGIAARLEIIGDGPDRTRCELLGATLGVSDRVTFAGWQPPVVVHAAYARAHFLVLPSATEGWPKVLSEGMAYGVVPIAGAVGAIEERLRRLETGCALAFDDTAGFAAAIAEYVAEPVRWTRDSERAVAGAPQFTFAHYLDAVDELLRDLGVASA